jgi:hypothetical protein
VPSYKCRMIRIVARRSHLVVAVVGTASVGHKLGAAGSWCSPVVAPPEAALYSAPQSAVQDCRDTVRTKAIVERLREWRTKAVFLVRCLLRLLRHGWVLGPTAALAPLAYLRATRDSVTGELDGMEWWWDLLAHRVERSGPALLKFLQWASTRRDLFPKAFCKAAARLQVGSSVCWPCLS